jgi:hypothetical protein
MENIKTFNQFNESIFGKIGGSDTVRLWLKSRPTGHYEVEFDGEMSPKSINRLKKLLKRVKGVYTKNNNIIFDNDNIGHVIIYLDSLGLKRREANEGGVEVILYTGKISNKLNN